MKQKLLLLLAVLATAINTSAYDFEVDGFYYNYLSIEDKTCEVTSGDNNYSGDIIIPSTVTYSGNTYSVTEIGKSAFSACSSLTSVTIPNSVTTIGYMAFAACYDLTSVTIGNSVTKIGESAFSTCPNLTEVEIPNSVIEIGNSAFSGCHGLTSVVIPNSVTTIGMQAFCNCYKLTSVTIGNSVTTIGYMAFYACHSLPSVVIPNSVVKIGAYGFDQCMNLTSVVIGNSVTEIEDCAFSYCDKLKEITSLAVLPPGIHPATFNHFPKEECTLIVPDESLEAYKTAEYWKEFFNIVGITSTDISTPSARDFRNNGKAYNLNGTEANDDYHGIVIKNGKKVMIKAGL